MEYLTDLMERIQLQPEARAVVSGIRPLIAGDALEKIRIAFFRGEDTNPEIETLAERLGCEKYGMFLTVYLLLSETTREIYRERGIDEAIFYDTMTDIPIWVNVSFRDYGIWGLREYGWIAGQLRARLFRLGRLQFERIEYRFAQPYTRAGRTIQNGDPIINMHIPEGDSITLDKRLDSYRRAYRFFNLEWFTCGSWLLYPAHYDFLPKNSNIRSFMDDFDIISSHEEHSPGNLWRIFNRRNDNYPPEALPRDTALRRAYADHWAQYGTTGEGVGIFLFDGENIV